MKKIKEFFLAWAWFLFKTCIMFSVLFLVLLTLHKISFLNEAYFSWSEHVYFLFLICNPFFVIITLLFDEKGMIKNENEEFVKFIGFLSKYSKKRKILIVWLSINQSATYLPAFFMFYISYFMFHNTHLLYPLSFAKKIRP